MIQWILRVSTFHKLVFGMKLIERGNLFALGFCHLYGVVLVRLRSYDDSAHSFGLGSQVRCVLLFFFCHYGSWPLIVFVHRILKFNTIWNPWENEWCEREKRKKTNNQKLCSAFNDISKIHMRTLFPEPILHLKHKFYQYSFILNS